MIEAGYRALSPTWDEATEDKISRTLLDVFRHKKGAGAELPAIKPTVPEAVRLLQETERPALVIAPASQGAPPDIEVFQTYASGPMSEVDSIIWPNPGFDNNITVYGPEVRNLAKRYLTQMIDELTSLPHPDGRPGSASIPIALHNAVREGVITRPMRIFAPGFGAGAVGGYVVMRFDPAVVA